MRFKYIEHGENAVEIVDMATGMAMSVEYDAHEEKVNIIYKPASVEYPVNAHKSFTCGAIFTEFRSDGVFVSVQDPQKELELEKVPSDIKDSENEREDEEMEL